MVLNVHERRIAASAAAVGGVLDTLATQNDCLWAWEHWPPMRFPGGLRPGAEGGHGPVRYAVVERVSGRRVRFRFQRPGGFHGHHEFRVDAVPAASGAEPEAAEAAPRPENACILRHEIAMSLSGTARLSWPLVFRPLHDALIEESFDKVERGFGAGPAVPHRRSLWVRFLRRLLARK
ncbi:SRPBCC family protein [Sediminivirga luteola]|uniref:Polyketide cyclase/dehydrase/lipid transport protein n=1 Tax=Sediminivirga luteola TaxID=1774748 RepID=A0A8J2TXL1_9MICO|nr:SRPBCC family protein [Sediminivirga luteola]GGA12913.1 hypothetical protein GCM10011333_14770 [Sediminivirga luteola]